MTQTPPDARLGNAYRPDAQQSGDVLRALMADLPTTERFRPGTMLQTPDETRSIAPMSKNQASAYGSKLVADTIAQTQGDVERAITTSTGFTPYVLETPAKVIFPVRAPLVQRAPRMVGKGTDIEHWKSVTSVFNAAGPFSQTHLGGTSDGSTTIDSPVYVLGNYQSSYQTIAEYNSVTFQAQWRNRALEGDMLARRKMELLYALKLQEENWLINGASKCWAPAPPLAVSSITAGSLVAGSYWYQITAVNGNGETLASTMVGPVVLGATGQVTLTFSGVPWATSYNIYAAKSATKPANGAMFIQVAADFLSGALPVQPTDYVGSMSISTVHQTLATTGANPPASNTATVNTNLFDGAQSLCYLNAAGSPLSVGESGMGSVILQPAAASGLLALQDIQYLLRKMYSFAAADPECLFVSPVEAVTIDNLIGAQSNFRIYAEPNSAGSIQGLTVGQKVTKVLNQVTGTEMDLVTLPFLPQGTIMAGSFSIPFPAPSVQDPPFRVMVNQDYTSIDYPPSQANPQTYGFGCFVDETLVNQYQGGWGVLQGIQPAAGV